MRFDQGCESGSPCRRRRRRRLPPPLPPPLHRAVAAADFSSRRLQINPRMVDIKNLEHHIAVSPPDHNMLDAYRPLRTIVGLQQAALEADAGEPRRRRLQPA